MFIGLFVITFGLNYISLIMSSPKSIHVKESLSELKKLLKGSARLIIPRVRMLIEIKKHEADIGISKRALAELVGVNHNSIQTWRTLYIQGGLSKLTSYVKNEGRPSILNEAEHQAMENKLKDPTNGLRGYVELLSWAKKEFKKQLKYNTIMKYSIKNFGTKIKVARKSHINKDPEAVITFKKTLVKSVNTLAKLKGESSKK